MLGKGSFLFSGLRPLLAGCLLAAACHAADPVLVTDFKAGQPNGAYAFASSTPETLPELLKGGGDPVNIVGSLFLPPGTDKAPMVLFLHGAGGPYEAMYHFWPQLLNKQGIGVFSLDRFGPRGAKSQAEEGEDSVPYPADVADAFAALRLLASHPRVDPAKVAVLGVSRGGTAAWRCAVERIIASQKLPEGLRFSAHIMLYSAGCSGPTRLIVKPGVFSPAPQLWVHGTADDWCPIGPVQDYAKRIADAGTPVQFEAIKGAWHKFDNDDQKNHLVKRAKRISEDCPLEQDIDTLYEYDHRTGQRLSGDAFKQASEGCRAFGAHVEGNSFTRGKAGDMVVAFLKKTYGM
jgi:dienelactone hydrolase